MPAEETVLETLLESSLQSKTEKIREKFNQSCYFTGHLSFFFEE